MCTVGVNVVVIDVMGNKTTITTTKTEKNVLNSVLISSWKL